MRYLFIIALFSISVGLRCQTNKDTTKLILDFPLVDFPYQTYATNTTGNFFKGYANPSMKQSLAMSNNLYSSAHWGIKKLIHTKSEFLTILLRYSAAAGFDLFTTYTPFGSGWLHEEYHRAVLTRRNVNSFNDMNTFPFGSEIVAVRKVEDADLAIMADNHKPDFRRLMVAGNEATYHQIQSLQSTDFFYDQELPHLPLYWLNTFGAIFYVNQSSSESFNDLVDEVNATETEVEDRDFTGPDFTAWAYELFNTVIPYTERGAHPTGAGIDRYIKPADLSNEALTYLQQQGNLQWINILSPNLFGFPKIKLKTTDAGNHYGNLAFRHLMTSFGNDISLDLFYQNPTMNLLVSLHNYNNFNRSFFGLEGRLIDHSLLNDKLLLSGRCMAWLQPENQSFMTSDARFGGLLGVRGAYRFGKSLLPYVEIEGKSKGWVMGNVFLNENISVNLGLSLHI